MYFQKQSFLLLLTLSSTATGFVAPATIRNPFGLLSTRICSTQLFSEEATDASAPVEEPVTAAEAALDEAPTEPEPERFTIYISNVPFVVEDSELEAAFAKFGTVTDVSIPRRKESGDSRGFAFIDMSSREELEKAVEGMNGVDFGGRTLTVNESLPKEELTKKEPAPRRGRAKDTPKIYVGNLPYGVSEDDLKELFSEHGDVIDVFLSRDANGKDRGFGFVTMGSDEQVDVAAGAVDGSFFQGRRLAARRPLPEGTKQAPKSVNKDVTRIYFGNLSFETTAETMRAKFEEYGEVMNIFINEDFSTGKSRGYGFLQMSNEAAPAAIAALDGIDVDGRTIRVSVSEDKVDKLKIYVGSLAFDTTPDTIRSRFEEYGEVYSVYMPEDKEYGGSRGFAIVAMDSEGGAKAIQELNDAEVDGRNIRVNPATPKGSPKTSTTKIYIGNLDFDTDPDTIKDVFSEFGEVKDCILPEDREFGGSRGFGFVVMDPEAAKAAIDELDGLELDGRVIRVVAADGRKADGPRSNNNNDYNGEYEE